MAGKLNLTIEKGATFDPIFVWLEKDLNGVEAPKDLTGYAARAHFREELESASPFLSCTTEDARIILGGTNGTVQFDVSDSVTAAITVSGGVWDLELIAPVTGKVTRLLEGKVKISPEVTRP